VVAAVGAEITQVRRPSADAIEVVEGDVHPCLMGNGQQVQHSVGRSPESHQNSDRILERFPGEDLAGSQVGLEHFHHGLAGTDGVLLEQRIHCRHGGTARK